MAYYLTFPVYITVKYRSNSILIIIRQILPEIWPFFDLVFVSVLILVSDFIWKFTEGYTIVKYMYKSSLILVISCKILAELWPFFDLVLLICWYWFPFNNFCSLIETTPWSNYYNSKGAYTKGAFGDVTCKHLLLAMCWPRVQLHNILLRGQQHSFLEMDREIFSTVIPSLPLIQEG